MNEQNNISPTPQINNGIPPQQPVPQQLSQEVVNQNIAESPVNPVSPVQQMGVNQNMATEMVQPTAPVGVQSSDNQPVQPQVQQAQVNPAMNPQPVQPQVINSNNVVNSGGENIQQPISNPIASQPIQPATVNTMEPSGQNNMVQQVQQPQMQQQVQQPQPQPVNNNQPSSMPNNGVFSPSIPIGNNDVTNVGFVAASSDTPKKKNKGLIIGIVLAIIIILAVVGYFVVYPFIMKTYFNNPKNVYDSTIKSVFKNISTTTNNLVHTKAIYDIEASFDSNIEDFKDFAGYTYNINLGIDPENKLLQEEFTIKDTNTNTDYFYKYYLKKNKIYESYSGSSYRDYIYRGEADSTAANDLFKLFSGDELFENSNKLDSTEIEYIINKLSDSIVGSIDESKLSKEDSSITINGKTLKVTNNKYKIDQETVINTVKYIKDEIVNDDKALDIIAKFMEISKAEVKEAINELKFDEDKEKDDEEYYLTASIYTYGTKNEILGFALDSSDDEFDIHYYAKDDNFELRLRSNTENEVTGKIDESVIEVIGKKEGSNTNITVTIDEKEVINVILRQFDDKGIDFDYTLKTDTGDITGTIKFVSDINNDRAKFKFDASARMGKEYITVALNITEDWTTEVANINTDTAITLSDEEVAKVQQDLMTSLSETPIFKALFSTSGTGGYDPSISDYYNQNGYETPEDEDWNI